MIILIYLLRNWNEAQYQTVTRYLLMMPISQGQRQWHFADNHLSFFPPKHHSPAVLSYAPPCVILHSTPYPFLSFSSSYLSVKPISSKIFTNPPRAYPPQKYTYPDPIPEFAEAETQKFRAELLKKFSKDRDTFGDDLDTVIEVCVEVLNDFLHKEYGGPGTLLVEPFTNMLIALKGRKIPGAPLAARTSLLWAQNNIDQDWEIWMSNPPK
ncbi:Protein PLASTID REDOX INSENSITIVE 2 [Melia azedarach]|uniref:Protein PLASTID REDOX INSENSITIVE 2 n=1 Tax=Melia azedarach TaxID=155640 RepID=A0ACC1XLF4_MELAZ|nr:Protein PLASTID REDOX INSENSITIVE 2 [Melia azedarach]